jgi:8-oxoguanine deaminase
MNLNRIEFAGALHDPVSAIVFCQPKRVDYTVVGGKFVIKDGQLITVEEQKIVEKHNKAAKRLVLG